MATKFDIRKFAKEQKQFEPRRLTWLDKAIQADSVVGWQVVDLINEWIASGPIRKDYPTKLAFARLLAKLDCVHCGEQIIGTLLTEVERGQATLPSK
jgi:hypothetical protein